MTFVLNSDTIKTPPPSGMPGIEMTPETRLLLDHASTQMRSHPAKWLLILTADTNKDAQRYGQRIGNHRKKIAATGSVNFSVRGNEVYGIWTP